MPGGEEQVESLQDNKWFTIWSCGRIELQTAIVLLFICIFEISIFYSYSTQSVKAFQGYSNHFKNLSSALRISLDLGLS